MTKSLTTEHWIDAWDTVAVHEADPDYFEQKRIYELLKAGKITIKARVSIPPRQNTNHVNPEEQYP